MNVSPKRVTVKMLDPNAHIDPCAYYYDADYPSARDGGPNFDDVAHAQGIVYDLDRYEELALLAIGPILEIGCGTGRVAIPLARAGHHVVGVDVSNAMIEQFERKLSKEPAEVQARVRVVAQDIQGLDLEEHSFGLATLAFNSLLFITSEAEQRRAVTAAKRHLRPSAILAVDIVNHVYIKREGVPEPRAFFTRVNPVNGNAYTRFDCVGPCDNEGRQRIYGHYVEVDVERGVQTLPYEMTWRPLDRQAVESMLTDAGFRIDTIEGGHRHEPYTESSNRMFIVARA